MRFNIYFVLNQLMIFCQYRLISVNAMIGENLRNATEGTFTYAVSIMVIDAESPQSGGEHLCTGVLITRKDVLMAEHCLEEDDLNTTQMLVGTIDLRNGTIMYPYWWISYDQWADTCNVTDDFGWNDIANIRLLAEVSDRIRPVQLSRYKNFELFNKQVKIVGWGVNEQDEVPDILKYAVVRVIENDICEDMLRSATNETIPVDERILCSHIRPYVLVLNGDSGGPLIYHNKLIGINQGTCPGAAVAPYENRVNLHFGTDYYRDFISSVVHEY